MAGKNTVTLTFAAESKSLEQAFDRVGAGAKKAEENIDGLDAGASRLQKALGTGGRSFGDYGRGLGGVGDRADELDTRMMGLSDGIQGVTDLMGGNGKLRPHEMAMAFSDLGSAAYNTVIPSLQSVGKGLGNLAAQFGSAKAAALATGAAIGAAGLVLALKQYNDAADEARGVDLAEEFKRSGDAAEQMKAAAEGDVFAMGDLSNAFGHLLDESPLLAQAFVDQAEAAGVNQEAVDAAQRAIDELADSNDRSAESIRAVTDAFTAQQDPFFAVIDADRQLRDAQQGVAEALGAVNDAVAEHGDASPEHLAAIQALSDARLAEAEAGLSQENAIRNLSATMLESGASVDDVISHLQGLADRGVIAQGSVDEVSRSLRDVPRRVDSTLAAHDLATTAIDSVGTGISVLDGRRATVTIDAQVTAAGKIGAYLASFGAAEGGIVPQYLAAGGMGGPRGTDTIPAWLTPGEMVLNDMQQAELWAMANGRGRSGGGGPHVTVIVEGSVFDGGREIERHVRDALQRGGFAGLVR